MTRTAAIRFAGVGMPGGMSGGNGGAVAMDWLQCAAMAGFFPGQKMGMHPERVTAREVGL